MSEDDELAQRRAALVEERKLELDAVYDKHDSMLRELFHIQKFVTLIGFDPQTAKQEKSAVWEEFSEPYDLWSQTSSGPSSRRTRRAINERRESLAVQSQPQPPTTPAPKQKRKPKPAERNAEFPPTPPNLGLLASKRPTDKSKTYKAKIVRPQPFAEPTTPGPGSSSRKRPKDREEEEDIVPVEDIPEPVSPSKLQHPDSSPLPKRIRLIVKPPPPPLIATHPGQLPKPSAFGGSLSRLLSSFALLEEGDEDVVEKKTGADTSIRRPGDETPTAGKAPRPKIGITWDEFEESVQSEVEIWARIREAKEKGWLGCMRGWEIVRGEEDEEEEEEEEEGGDTEEEVGDGEVRAGQAMIGEDETPTLMAEHSMAPGAVLVDTEMAPPESTLEGTTETGRQVPTDRDNPPRPEPEPAPETIAPTPEYQLLPGVLPELTHRPRGAHFDLGPNSFTASPRSGMPSLPDGATGANTGSTTSLASTPMPLNYPSSSPEADTPMEPISTEPIVPDAPEAPEPARRTPTPTPRTPTPTLPIPLPALPFLPSSPYEALLASIPLHAQRIKTTPLLVRHRPAKLIARYWEQLQGAADRLVAAEERRIRAGAKAVARGVIAKAWKDAVAVIRARLKEQEEAEQAREGRKHLAAILEQSSALLETQQEDLGLGRRHGGSRSRSRSSQIQSDRSDQSDREEKDGSEADTEVDEEEGGSEMLLDVPSRDASEGRDMAEGEDRSDEERQEDDKGSDEEHEVDDEDEDLDVDVGDETDLAAYRTDSQSINEPNHDFDQEETFTLSDLFDAAPAHNFDAMSLVESVNHSPEPDATSIIEGNAMSIDGASASLAQDMGHPTVNDRLNGKANTSNPHLASNPDPAVNGHPTAHRTQKPTTESNGHRVSHPTTPRSPMNTSPITSAPSTIRKLTLKVKSPEPALEARRRPSRRTSVSKSGAGDNDSDSEADALARDAELPLEEIMKRYGYVGINEMGADQSSTPGEPDSDDESEQEETEDTKPAAALLGLENVAPTNEGVIRPPFLLRGTLRPYQQSGMEWLVSGYTRGVNGILADEMGLGKTIQTIALLAHLACDRGIWGPHLIIVPTSVILNWEMEFKKFLPGFKVLSYYGSIKERKERRVGWNTEHSFNVIVTSYQLVLADQAIFRRKRWHYMILDEAHNIKNFKSQRWATLFSFNSERRLLLTGTPLQNNITELWSLLYFVQPDTANKQQFEEWFLDTMRQAVETGNTMDEQTRDTIDKLHTVLRPYILRRLKCDVEQQLPSKHEHIIYCRLSKRQRYLYDEFMSRAQTKETLSGGNFLSIVNCLMQLRKVCNHPDLFEVRPILTSFAIPTGRSAVVDYEIKELLVRRRLLRQFDDDEFNINDHPFDLMANAASSSIIAKQRAALNPSRLFSTPGIPGEPPPKDLRTFAGNKKWLEYQRRVEAHQRHRQLLYINTRRNGRIPVFGAEKLALVRALVEPLVPTDVLERRKPNPDAKFGAAHMIKSYAQRVEFMGDVIDRFAFATPNVVALDIPRLSLAPLAPSNLSGHIALNSVIQAAFNQPEFDVLHRSSVKLQIAFPDSSLLQYDCGKLQELDALLREKHAGGHRVLIFTQMTRVLDILEIFLNFHGYRYLRLDGSTKIEQRQVVTERFNVDNRIFAFIASSRSGGVGINLTGADTVIFYDSDYNPSMDKQCEDRAHRIGQTREVSIYRFISKHTVEESMLRKANQKRLLDDLVIRQGEFDWRQVMVDDVRMESALAEVEDKVDADAARMAAGEEQRMDWNDFEGAGDSGVVTPHVPEPGLPPAPGPVLDNAEEDEDEEDGLRPIERYMLRVVEDDWDFFG